MGLGNEDCNHDWVAVIEPNTEMVIHHYKCTRCPATSQTEPEGYVDPEYGFLRDSLGVKILFIAFLIPFSIAGIIALVAHLLKG